MGLRGPISTSGITAPSGKPPRPKMPKEIGTVWTGLVRDMEEVGTLAKTDGAAIEMLARAIVRARKIEKDIDKTGWVVEGGRSGEVKSNPAASILLSTERLVATQLDKFGLTPTGRARARGSASEETDPLKDLDD